MTVGKRIRQLRRALDLTQQAFADRLGVSRGNIGSYETDKSNIGPAAFSLICREFNVSEVWLRTGKGEMFEADTTLELGEYVRAKGATDLEEEIIRAWFDLPKDERQRLMVYFRNRLSNVNDPIPAEAETREERMKREAREEADEYYRLRLEEKRQIAAEADMLDGTGPSFSNSGANTA